MFETLKVCANIDNVRTPKFSPKISKILVPYNLANIIIFLGTSNRFLLKLAQIFMEISKIGSLDTKGHLEIAYIKQI